MRSSLRDSLRLGCASATLVIAALVCGGALWPLAAMGRATMEGQATSGALPFSRQPPAAHAFRYFNRLTIPAPVDDVADLNRRLLSGCYQDDRRRPHIIVENYALTCDGKAWLLGEYEIQIGQAANPTGPRTVLVIELR